jgi:hypothetical protein
MIFFHYQIFIGLSVISASLTNPLKELFEKRNDIDCDVVIPQIIPQVREIFDLSPSELLQFLSPEQSGSLIKFSIFFWKVKGSLMGESAGKNSTRLDKILLDGLVLYDSPWVSKEYLREGKRALETYILDFRLERERGWCEYYGNFVTFFFSLGFHGDIKICRGSSFDQFAH